MFFIEFKSFSDFPGGSLIKEPPASARDAGLIPGMERSPGGRHGNPLQYSCLENPHGQRILEGYSPWGRKELDTTERLSTAQHTLRSEEERRTGKKRQGTEFLLIRGVKALFHSTLS